MNLTVPEETHREEEEEEEEEEETLYAIAGDVQKIHFKLQKGSYNRMRTRVFTSLCLNFSKITELRD